MHLLTSGSKCGSSFSGVFSVMLFIPNVINQPLRYRGRLNLVVRTPRRSKSVSSVCLILVSMAEDR